MVRNTDDGATRHRYRQETPQFGINSSICLGPLTSSSWLLTPYTPISLISKVAAGLFDMSRNFPTPFLVFSLFWSSRTSWCSRRLSNVVRPRWSDFLTEHPSPSFRPYVPLARRLTTTPTSISGVLFRWRASLAAFNKLLMNFGTWQIAFRDTPL